MINTADRKSVRAAEKAAERAERNNGEVLIAICSHQNGRRYLWDKLASHCVFSSTYSADPGAMAFNEGRRSAGLELLAEITKWAPDQFIQMMREANQRETETADQPENEDGQRDDHTD